MEKEKKRRGGLYTSDCDVLKERYIQTPRPRGPVTLGVGDFSSRRRNSFPHQ